MSRCTDCGLMFFADASRDDRVESQDYAPGVADRLAHLKRVVAAVPTSVLAVVPPRAVARVDGIDVVTVDDLLTRGAPDPPYDAVVCVDALDRVYDAGAVLRQIRAALAPGASASFTSLSVESTAARYGRASWRGFRNGASTFYSPDTLQSLLTRNGFRHPKIYTDGAMRPGSLRIRTAARALGLVGLRGFAVRAQANAGLLDESMTVVTTLGELIDRHKLSVIVPVYNEHTTVRELLDRLLEKRFDRIDVEIIVVESNSTDGSREAVMSYATDPRVTVLLQERPRGKGNAVRTGLAHATGDIVLFQDADLEYEIDDYDDLLEPICAYRRNFVIGSRHVKGSAWKIRDFNDAPVLSQVFNLGHVAFLSLLNGIYGQSLADPFSMFKVFRRDCLAGLVFECDRFDFDFEIVIKLLRKGYRPLEVPVNYHSRSIAEGKKVTMVRDPLTWLRALARFRTSALYPGDAPNASA